MVKLAKISDISIVANDNSGNSVSAMPDKSSNVLLKASPLPYQTPQFDKIKITDYEPAFEQGMTEQAKEIKDIAQNQEPATFENTVLALEKSGELLSRARTVFFNLSSIQSNDEIQRIEAAMAPKLSAHSDNMLLNPTLFKRVKNVYDNRESLSGYSTGLEDSRFESMHKYL